MSKLSAAVYLEDIAAFLLKSAASLRPPKADGSAFLYSPTSVTRQTLRSRATEGILSSRSPSLAR